MLEKARQLSAELSRLRREIHRNPELSFREFKTAALVADTLAEIGIQAKTGVGRTGVVGQIGTGSGPTIAIRADMDALPIREQNQDNAYCSQEDGVMHACGHDAHTAILLGAAHLLQQSFAEGGWQGNVRLLFQPSEEAFDENGVSGATAMIDDGALAGVDAVIALHVDSIHPAGEVHLQDGYSLAAVDSFEAWLYGDGGHGAYPHQGSDPIHMLGQILNGVYAIPSRRIDPLRNCVISIGQVSGGAAPNVIPNEVYLQGTIRSHAQPVREQLWVELENVLKISELMGGRYEFVLHKGYPGLYNDPEVNGWMRQVAQELAGETAVIEAEFGMGAEDFAYMAQQAKGAMFMLGAAIPDGLMRNHHTDIFDIDERVMPLGAAILAETAVRFVTGKV
ncbi:MAG: amidohydrolase [Ardenticatenaceae bacterium]|nr:amidohydrolase [Ardenticatenaceae bacterium]